MDFAVPADRRVKLKEREKKDKYLDHARELEKMWNIKVTFIPIIIGALGTVTEGLLKELGGGLGNKRTSEDNPYYYTIGIGQNTEKSPGDLRRLFGSQTSVWDHQCVKKSQEIDNNDNINTQHIVKNKNNLTEMNRKLITIETPQTQTTQNKH